MPRVSAFGAFYAVGFESPDRVIGTPKSRPQTGTLVRTQLAGMAQAAEPDELLWVNLVSRS